MVTQVVVCQTIDILKIYYKKIEIDLSKQQALDANLKPIKQINSTACLENNSSLFFIIEEVK